jgi:hypothetical protein
MRTKQPAPRITKWLRSSTIAEADVPLEGECTACADVQFRAPFNLGRHRQKPFHQPDRERFQEALQRAFDRHVKLVHAEED